MLLKINIIIMGSLVDFILNRVNNQNRNFICIVVGPTGSGKSYACLSFADKLTGGTFNIKNVCFGAREFIDRVSSPQTKKGSVLVFEESGISMDNRNFYSSVNKTLSYVFEVFRTDNIVLFLNVPNITFVDKKIRELCHAVIEMKRVDYKKNISYGSIKLTKNSGMGGKTYHIHLRSTKEGRLKITNWRFPKPNKRIIKQYEDKRLEYKINIKADAISSINKAEHEDESLKKRHMKIEDYYNILVEKYGTIAKLKKAYTRTYAGKFGVNNNKIVSDLNIVGAKERALKLFMDEKFGYL